MSSEGSPPLTTTHVNLNLRAEVDSLTPCHQLLFLPCPCPSLLSSPGLAACQSTGFPFEPSVALSMAYYSASAYCDPSQVNSWSCKPCELAGVASNASFFTNSALNVAGFAAKLATGDIVLSFRGTQVLSIQNWIADLTFVQSSIYGGCNGCLVHEGFYQSYLDLSTSMLNALTAYGAQPDTSSSGGPQIFITGHSLGGAIATLAAFELTLAGYNVAAVHTFGSPRVGNPAYSGQWDQVVGQGNTTGISFNKELGSMEWSPLLKAAVRRAVNAAKVQGEGKPSYLGSPLNQWQAQQAELVREAVEEGKRQLEERAGGGAGTGTAAALSRTRAMRHAGSKAVLQSWRKGLLSKLQIPAPQAAQGLLQEAGAAIPTFRVTHGTDPVPHLPLEDMIVSSWRHVLREVYYNELETSWKECSATDSEDPTCSDSNLADLSILDHLNYMGIEIGLLC